MVFLQMEWKSEGRERHPNMSECRNYQQNISEEYKNALGMFKGPSETNKTLDLFSAKKKSDLSTIEKNTAI